MNTESSFPPNPGKMVIPIGNSELAVLFLPDGIEVNDPGIPDHLPKDHALFLEFADLSPTPEAADLFRQQFFDPPGQCWGYVIFRDFSHQLGERFPCEPALPS